MVQLVALVQGSFEPLLDLGFHFQEGQVTVVADSDYSDRLGLMLNISGHDFNDGRIRDHVRIG